MAMKHSTASISIGSSSGTLSRLKKLGRISPLIHLFQQGDSYHSRQDMQMNNRPAHNNMSSSRYSTGCNIEHSPARVLAVHNCYR